MAVAPFCWLEAAACNRLLRLCCEKNIYVCVVGRFRLLRGISVVMSAYQTNRRCCKVGMINTRDNNRRIVLVWQITEACSCSCSPWRRADEGGGGLRSGSGLGLKSTICIEQCACRKTFFLGLAADGLGAQLDAFRIAMKSSSVEPAN